MLALCVIPTPSLEHLLHTHLYIYICIYDDSCGFFFFTVFIIWYSRMDLELLIDRAYDYGK